MQEMVTLTIPNYFTLMACVHGEHFSRRW